MKIERTRDWELVRSIVTHPKIYEGASDDFSVKREDWKPIESDSIHYVLISESGPLGVFIVVPQNAICWQVHTCLLPECYGELARCIGRESTKWLFANTPCLRITTEVPAYNRLALKFAKDCGMSEYGLNPKSYMKHGKLRDLILLGVSKCQLLQS